MTSRRATRQRVHRGVPGVLATLTDSAQAFPRHTHDSYGVGIVRRGAQRSWSGAGTVDAGPGDVIMVNPGEVHDGTPLDERGRCWQMLYLDPVLVRGDAAELSSTRGGEPLWRPIARDVRLVPLFEACFAAVCGGGDRLAQEQAQVALLGHLLLHHAGLRAPPALSPSIARARQRIDDDPAADHGLAELAAEAAASRFQLLRAFQRELGLTPHAYVLQRRIALARCLIAQGSALADVAHGAGFADQSHMTRAFVRHLGYTPGAFAAG